LSYLIQPGQLLKSALSQGAPGPVQPVQGSPGSPLAGSLSSRPLVKSLGRSVSGQALVDAWGEFLGKMQFDWFTTHTFRHPVGPQAANAAWADWVRWVRRRNGHRAEWFRVTERTVAGAIHFHALLGRCGQVRRLSALDYWRHRYGFGQVVRFDRRLGAPHYISKYVSKNADGELDCQFSRRFRLLLGGVRPGKAA